MTTWDDRYWSKIKRKHELRRSAPLTSTKGLKRSPIKSRGPTKDIPPKTRKAVERRSKGLCEIEHEDCTGVAVSMHHRKLRRHGDHRACNLIHLCQVMHGYIHDHTWVAYQEGWLVHSTDDPATIPWTSSK